jgi:serine phosphatase RsbU (regulator of sigma subunit)
MEAVHPPGPAPEWPREKNESVADSDDKKQDSPGEAEPPGRTRPTPQVNPDAAVAGDPVLSGPRPKRARGPMRPMAVPQPRPELDTQAAPSESILPPVSLPAPPPTQSVVREDLAEQAENERPSEGSGAGWSLEPEDEAAEEVEESQPLSGDGYGYGDAGDAPPSSEVLPTVKIGSPRLSIANLLSPHVVRAVQDTFWSTAQHPAFVLDADGRAVVGNSPFILHAKADLILNHLIDPVAVNYKGPVMFPIIADGQRVGSVAFDPHHLPLPLHVYRQKLAKYIASKGVKKAQDVASIMRAAERVFSPNAGTAATAALQMAKQLSRLCEQEVALRERIEELGTLGHMTTLLAGERDLKHRLNAAVRSAVAVLNVKAACIRILDDATNTMRVAAAYNLSRDYMTQALVESEPSSITSAAFAGETVFIDDLSTDDRVVFQTQAVEEGLVTCMIVGMIYRNKPLGTFHVFTGDRHVFSRSAVKLFTSIAKLTASAIENSRRDAEGAENQRVQRQLKLATDVQRRMLPRSNPVIPGFEIDARYVPSFEIGGDFYDFINLGPNMGIAMGDVSGKGIAAGLLMAGARASLRAYAQDHYDIDQVMSRVNRSLVNDTHLSEFVTVFFGVLDPSARLLTYCNAGHEPPLLLRGGQITKLEEGGMVVGIDPEQVYKRGVMQLRPGDLLLFYTDGLSDAQNFDRKRFGKDRIIEALHECDKLGAKAAVNHILWQMRRFVGMNHPTDDTTIVVVRVTE